MTTKEVADKLVTLCRKGSFLEAYGLYADEATSVEMEGMPGDTVTKGKDNILKGFEQWQNDVEEMHSSEIGNPMVAGNHFVMPMTTDITFKERGRHKMEQLCVYQVDDGKIIKASFHYEVPNMG